MIRTAASVSLSLFLLAGPASAGMEDFEPGPVIAAFGPAAAVPDSAPLPEGAVFRIAYDTSKPAEEGKLNTTLVMAARFLNMHGRAGVAPENMSLAVVIHGAASADLMATQDNPNAPLIAALAEQDVRIILCGQTVIARDIDAGDLLPGVEISLSAMTAHALLQQEGYTLNPF